jgi:hypothetical protein
MKTEQDEIKHKKLDEELDKSKDDVKMKKNESMFGSKAYWMKKSG